MSKQDEEFFLLSDKEFRRFLHGFTNLKVWEETATDGPLNVFGTTNTGRYHLMLEVDVTDAMVGLGKDKKTIYSVPWELSAENDDSDSPYLIFLGWGDDVHGCGIERFNYHQIAGSKVIFLEGLGRLMEHYSSYLTPEKMKNIVGLRGCDFP
jgi:hypothetical protein